MFQEFVVVTGTVTEAIAPAVEGHSGNDNEIGDFRVDLHPTYWFQNAFNSGHQILFGVNLKQSEHFFLNIYFWENQIFGILIFPDKLSIDLPGKRAVGKDVVRFSKLRKECQGLLNNITCLTYNSLR